MRIVVRAIVLAFSLAALGSLLPFSYGCSLFGGGDTEDLTGDQLTAAEREICQALDVDSSQAFLDNGNSAHFEQLDNDQDVFIFTSSVAEAFDGQNVVELVSAVVDIDFEDDPFDPGNLGGFWARWKLVFVPFTDERFTQFQTASSSSLLSQFIAATDRVETVLSGPYLQNDCEWGDTNEIGTQTLTYSNYPLYDWDFFPGTVRILGILYEGDDGIGDDVIAKLDISQNAGTLVFESAGEFRIEVKSLSNVAIAP